MLCLYVSEENRVTPSSMAPSRQATSRMTSSSQIEHLLPNYLDILKGMFAFSYIWSFGGHIHERCLFCVLSCYYLFVWKAWKTKNEHTRDRTISPIFKSYFLCFWWKVTMKQSEQGLVGCQSNNLISTFFLEYVTVV